MVNKKLKATVAFMVFLAFIGSCYLVYANFVFTFDQQFMVGAEEHITVWLDVGKTTELASGQTWSWGTVFIGLNQKSLWIENDGTVPVNLTLTVGGNLPVGWTETWDYVGSTVSVGATLQVTLTLTVPPGTPQATYTCTGSTITTVPA